MLNLFLLNNVFLMKLSNSTKNLKYKIRVIIKITINEIVFYAIFNIML